MGLSAGVVTSPLARAGARRMTAREGVALMLARAAYAAFYVALAALVFGLPAGVAYLLWYWLAH
jgi:hypothetical protein